jgi:hypothetical protein
MTLLEKLRERGYCIVYRRDCPELPALMQLVAEGLATQELVDYDEQGTALIFRPETVHAEGSD